MTSTETRAPRKRAPRKAAAPVEAGEKPGVDHHKAEAAREQLEADGQQVTAGAVRRIRERAAGAADRTVAAAFAAADAARAAREAAEADVPLPAEPGLEEDPDAAGDGCRCGNAVCAPASCPACAALHAGAPCPAGPVGVAARTARETAPRADAGDALDQVLAAADLTDEQRAAIGEHADHLAAAQPEDDLKAAIREAYAEAEADPRPFLGDSPATPPAELPAGVTACGPGAPTPADVAAIAAFAAELEARVDGIPVDVVLPTGQTDPLGPYPSEVASAMQHLVDTAAARADDDDEVDLRALSALPLEAAEIDVRSLVAGRVATAPDGRRVTVWDRAAAIVEVVNAAAQSAVDYETGEVIDLDGAGDPTRVTLSAADAAAIEEARALEARAGELKEAAEAIRSRIKEQLGGEAGRGEVAVDATGRELARWTRVTSTKCSTTALKKARPDVWAEFATTTVSRRFTWAD